MDLSERGVLEPVREQGLLAEDFHAGAEAGRRRVSIRSRSAAGPRTATSALPWPCRTVMPDGVRVISRWSASCKAVRVDDSNNFEGLAEVWLPESPDHRVAAVASFNPSVGARLRLLRGPALPDPDGAVEDGSADATEARAFHGLEELTDQILAGQPRRIPKLVGLLDGTPFLLLDGTLRLVSSPAFGPPVVEVTADSVLLNIPEDPGPIAFDRVMISTYWLTELASVAGLKTEITWPKDRTGQVRYTATAEPAGEVTGTVEHADGPVTATLRLHPSQASARRMITLAEDADLEFRFASPVSLARLREVWLPAVEDLVTLAAGRRDAANEVWLTREGLIDNERNKRASVRLLARRRHQPAPSDERFIPGVDGRFRIGETELGDLLTRWLKLQATDGQAIRLALAASDRGDSPVNLRAHVIGLNVAAEWWHRRRFDGHHADPDDHDQRVSRLLGAVEASPDLDEDDLEWLKRKLQNSNNKSQLDRLLDIAGSVAVVVRDLVGDPEAFTGYRPGHAHKWAQWVARARNTGSAHAGTTADPFWPYWAAESLRWVLIAALLTELAVPDVLSRFTPDSGYQICREHVQTITVPPPSQ